MPTLSWINAQPQDHIALDDRALHFGDGLFETFLISDGNIRFLPLHLQRLRKGLQCLKIHLPEQRILQDIELALTAVKNSSAKHSCWRLKYLVSRGQTQSGYQFGDQTSVNRIMMLQGFERDVAALQQQGVRVRSCDWLLSQQPQLAGIKHLNRLEQVMARSEWSASAIFEGLMSDQQGRVIEGTMSNLFAVDVNGLLITPSLTECGVEGVMRHAVLNGLAKNAGIHTKVQHLPDRKQLKELFISNALIGIVPVTQWDNDVFDIGPVTRALQTQLALQNSN